jgi:hypothetical protein
MTTWNRQAIRWQSVAEHWSYFGDRLRERWSRLTEDDIEAIGGSREDLARILHVRYGIEPQEIEALVTEWQKDVVDDTPTLVFWRPPERPGAPRSH